MDKLAEKARALHDKWGETSCSGWEEPHCEMYLDLLAALREAAEEAYERGEADEREYRDGCDQEE